MLNTAVRFPFSPSAFQASLQTSTGQECNRMTGVAMSLIKKCDVKNHLSSRLRQGGHLHRPASQPDATGFSGVEPGRAEPNTDPLIADLIKQASSIGPETTPIVIASSLSDAVMPAISKSAQA
jgi:wyosine [tRNA(Phe)-imidazoG37] synthetase (radical SAM superfamily)